MTIGAEKRAFITSRIAAIEPAPTLFLEFGSYVGYSAICLASALKAHAAPGQTVRYISFEKNPIIGAVAASLADLAGLRDVVRIHIGPAGESLKRLVGEGAVAKGSIDMMLLDHWKDFYISDLQLCESLSLLKPGSVVLADNIIFPGAPEYLAYVQAGKAEKSTEGFSYATETADFVLPFGGPVSGCGSPSRWIIILISPGSTCDFHCVLNKEHPRAASIKFEGVIAVFLILIRIHLYIANIVIDQTNVMSCEQIYTLQQSTLVIYTTAAGYHNQIIARSPHIPRKAVIK